MMEKYPLKGNNKSAIALKSLVNSPSKTIAGSGKTGGSSTGVTYQSVSKKKVTCPFHLISSYKRSETLYVSIAATVQYT